MSNSTLFGNVLAAAGDHPRLAYGMVGAVWWPRLLPLLPAEFRTSVGVAQAPMMALVNLSVVFAVLAVGGGTVMMLGGAVARPRSCAGGRAAWSASVTSPR